MNIEIAKTDNFSVRLMLTKVPALQDRWVMEIKSRYFEGRSPEELQTQYSVLVNRHALEMLVASLIVEIDT